LALSENQADLKNIGAFRKSGGFKNIGAFTKIRRIWKILAPQRKTFGFTKCWRLAEK
jgi:hypothetical protein